MVEPEGSRIDDEVVLEEIGEKERTRMEFLTQVQEDDSYNNVVNHAILLDAGNSPVRPVARISQDSYAKSVPKTRGSPDHHIIPKRVRRRTQQKGGMSRSSADSGAPRQQQHDIRKLGKEGAHNKPKLTSSIRFLRSFLAFFLK